MKNAELDFSSFYAFPVIEGALGLVAFIFFYLGLPPLVASSLSLFSLEFLEGFNHLDGLIDSGDAWMVRGGKEKKLEIMRDKYVGTGALAFLSFTLLITFSTLAYLPPASLAFSSSLASLSYVIEARLGTAPGDGGLGDDFIKAVRKDDKRFALSFIGALIPSAPLIFFRPVSGLIFILAIIILSLFGKLLDRTFGFSNGDVLGANYELSRALVLFLLLLFLH